MQFRYSIYGTHREQDAYKGKHDTLFKDLKSQNQTSCSRMGNLKNMHAMRNNVVKFCVEIMRPFGRALSGELAVFRVDTRQRTSTLFTVDMTTQSVTQSSSCPWAHKGFCNI